MKNITLTKPYIYDEVPANFNWENDIQPSRSINRQRALARIYKKDLVAYVNAMVAEHAPDAMVDTSEMRKSKASIERKLATDESVHGDPAQIGDYLRIRITVRKDNPAQAIRQIEDLREHLIFEPRITSFKDQFRVPCPEGGHRKFIASCAFGEGKNVLKAEIQICHEGMEDGPYDVPVKIMRAKERELAKLIKTDTAGTLGRHWSQQIKYLYDCTQAIRRGMNNEVATELGLNSLLNPDLRLRHDFSPAAANMSKPRNLSSVWPMAGDKIAKAGSALPKDSLMKQFISDVVASNGAEARTFH